MNKAHFLYKAVGEWAEKTFPDATSSGHLLKVKEEVDEALEKPESISEYADCLIALFGAAYKAEIAFDHLIKAALDKMEENKLRSWEKSANGTYQHVRKSDSKS